MTKEEFGGLSRGSIVRYSDSRDGQWYMAVVTGDIANMSGYSLVDCMVILKSSAPIIAGPDTDYRCIYSDMLKYWEIIG